MRDRSWPWLIALACRVAAWSTSWTQPTLMDTPSKSRRNSTTPRYEPRQISTSDDHLAQPGLGHRQLEQHRAVRHGRREGTVQRRASLVRLLVDEFAAYPMPGRQVADRLRLCQGLNGQVLAVTLGQPRRCANASIHTRPTAES